MYKIICVLIFGLLTSCCNTICRDNDLITEINTSGYMLSDLEEVLFIKYPKNDSFVNPIDSFSGIADSSNIIGDIPVVNIYPEHALSVEYNWEIQIQNRSTKIEDLQLGYVTCEACLLDPGEEQIELTSYLLDGIEFNLNYIILYK